MAQSKNNYEAVLFQKLAYSFGLKVNAEIYQNIAENIDFKIVQKISQNQFQLESLPFRERKFIRKRNRNKSKMEERI